MAIRIDGTNTAANPGITGADADTGLQFGTDEVSIVTGGTTRATVDSSGNVGIGTTSPAAKLHATGKIRYGSNTTYYGTIDHDAAATGANIYNSVDSGGHIFKRNNTIEQMRIDSSGNLLIGTTSTVAKLDIRMTGAATNNAIYAQRTGVSTAGQGIYSYMQANANLSGSSYALYGAYVAATGSPGGGCIGAVSSVYGILGYFDTSSSWAGYFNGSTYASGTYQGSDARLKDVIEPISGGILDKLASIQPVKYRWKENTDQRDSVGDGIQIGLIAQEVEEHFPELVKEITHTCPTNSEQLEEGQFDSSCSLNHELGTFKTLEYQHLAAVLVEALKEAKTRIETLEAKVAALETRLTALEGGSN